MQILCGRWLEFYTKYNEVDLHNGLLFILIFIIKELFIFIGKTMKVKNKIIKLIFISFVAIFPFFLSNYSDNVPPEK